MAFSAATSRFALLTDDAPDPFVKKGKVKPQEVTKISGGRNKAKNKQKSSQQPSKVEGKDISGPAKPKKSPESTPPNPVFKSKEKGEAHDWEDWEKRDSQFVDSTYEAELEEAIFQSKLEFEKQQGQTNAQTHSTKSKKKKVAVPLNEFHEMVASGSGVPKKSSKPEEEEGMIERLRIETQRDIQKEKKLAEEKALILSRNAHFVNGNVHALHNDTPPPEKDLDDRDQLILQLQADKQNLQEELGRVNTRFKKLLDLLSDTQLKEKVHLLRDLEKLMASNQELSKLNQDLNEELKTAYSHLEQERSKSHTALMEVKKINELSRRGRSHSHMETS